MPNLSAVAVLIIALVSALIGASVCYLLMRGQTVEVVERSAPPINHADGSVTAAKVTHRGPTKKAPSKPVGRDVRAFEAEILPDPVVCPSTGEVVQCRPVGVRIDWTELEDGLRGSIVAENGEVLDAADYPLAPWVQLAARKNLVQVQAFADGTKAASYSRKVLGRVWVGPSVLAPPDLPPIVGVTLGGEF